MSVSEGYTCFELAWRERIVRVSVQQNWLNSEHWHIELRCDDPLPVTETGYRSQFVPAVVLPLAADVPAYVEAWLDAAAKDPAWIKQEEDSRQMKLF